MERTDTTTVLDHDTWDLSPVFPDSRAWEETLREVERSAGELARFRGHLGDGPGALLACLDLYYEVLKDLYRVSSYASMRYHEDTRVAETAAMDQRARLVATHLSERAAFIDPEVLALGRERVGAYLEAEPRLGVFRHALDDILRRATHTRSAEEEEIIAMAGLVTDSPYAIYGMVANADTPWPTVRLSDGSDVVLDQAAYARYRASTNRADRQTVFEAFWDQWARYRRSFGSMLYAQMKRDLFYARVRRYPSCLAAALDADRIPEAVYRTLLREANAGLPLLHRYFELRRRMLGLDELRYYDVYPPLVRLERKYSVEEAKRVVCESLTPLGSELQTVTREAFESQWIDVHPRPGKRAGAYMNGHVYDVHPYILMNYNEDYESVSTLAHEWGHALHSHLTNRAQHFANSSYSIFVAEVASTLAEALVLDRMLADADSEKERLFFLGHALEGLRGTFFRQAMFAEFELTIHESVQRGEALTGDSLSTGYGELTRRYHGHEEGIVEVDDAYRVEWAYIPHFYYDFYVYQYATSLAASSLLADRIAAGDEDAVRGYLDLLRAGGNGYPYDLLRQAGVDLATAEPYEALMRRMRKIMDEIEGILDT